MDHFHGIDCQRVFLDWDSPLLPAVVGYFTSNFTSNFTGQSGENGQLDLSDWVFALPSTQSAQRLSDLLRESSLNAKLDYSPPRILTAGDLAETLYRPQRPIAIEFEQTLAWSRVLRLQDRDSLRPLVPVLPDADSIAPWLELAGTLRRLAADLATHVVTFGDVLALSETDTERERWKLLQKLFDLYLAELAQAGLCDQHEQRSRAIQRGGVQAANKIALIGTSDLNESVAKVVAKVDRDLISIIAAPESSSDCFDGLGRLKTESFAEFELALTDDQLLSASDISDQTGAVSEIVSDFLTRFDLPQIAVGTSDESHVTPTEMQLDGCGWPSYRHLGWTISSTAVGRLIESVKTLVARPTWQSLAALVRHADAHRYLQSKIESPKHDLLVELDRLLANHFPVRLSDPLPPKATENYPVAIEIRDQVVDWLKPFLADEANKTIAEWSLSLLEWIDSLDADLSKLDSEQVDRHLSTEAVLKVRELLTRFSKLSDHLDVRLSAGSALETLAGRISELRVGQNQNPGEIQIHGWLDLALNDSPAMVVIGFNHPFVPSAVTSDPFLPGSLRSKLKMADNDRRYARDVYAMQLILSTRRETDIKFIVGKNSADGSPTPPSRLLAAADQKSIARRVGMLLGGKRNGQSPTHRWDNQIKVTELPIPKITVAECPVRTMSVTAFKAYLDCPYRFYLRHVLKLKPIDDSANELAANQFGDLIHGAVEYFGESDAKDEQDESRIFDALRHHLDVYAKQHCSDRVESAVRLQIRQAEKRLRFVATEQAKRIDQGWRIYAIEASVEESKGAGIKVDGKMMGLRGRFDRIDQHIDTKQYAILDYKTHGHKPEKKHLKKNRETGEFEWIDLQLPLYRLMVPFLGIKSPPEEVQLGYFNVSDKAEETKINLADFPEPLMNDAEALIQQCIRRIFACDFQPTDKRVMYDDYEMILQTGVASRMLESERIAEGAQQE